jgi:hypothetical protein
MKLIILTLLLLTACRDSGVGDWFTHYDWYANKDKEKR